MCFVKNFSLGRGGGGAVKGGLRNDYSKIYYVFYNRNSRHMLPVVSIRQIEDKQGGGVGQFCEYLTADSLISHTSSSFLYTSPLLNVRGHATPPNQGEIYPKTCQ